MASFTKRNGKFRALIRRRGAPALSRTFRLKSQAVQWARETEDRIAMGGNTNLRDLRDITVGDILRCYRDEVSPARKGWKFETTRLTAFMREPWAHLDLNADVAAALRGWRDQRLQTVKPSTVVRELGLLGAVFTHAMGEWGLPLKDNPAHQVKRPVIKGGERDRLWSDADLQIWLDHCTFDENVAPIIQKDFIPWVLLIARRTGLRLGEICRIRMADIDLDVPMIRFDDTKNGDDYDCPLRTDAVNLIRKLMEHREGEDKLIEPGEDVAGQLYRREREEIAKQHPSHADIVMHSLRHTYTTEMVERVPDKMLLLRMTGRRNLQSLTRYYKPKARDLAKLMG